jgi:hypothetical protein
MRTTGENDFTYRILWPDGAIRWIRARAFPIRDAQGDLIRIAGFCEDITEWKVAKQKSEKLAEMLQVLTNWLFDIQEEERRRGAAANESAALVDVPHAAAQAGSRLRGHVQSGACAEVPHRIFRLRANDQRKNRIGPRFLVSYVISKRLTQRASPYFDRYRKYDGTQITSRAGELHRRSDTYLSWNSGTLPQLHPRIVHKVEPPPHIRSVCWRAVVTPSENMQAKD